MARPSKAERLEQIADAALEMFSERGFRLTQVADIAKKAGVAPGTIYLFAESKETLFWLAFGRAMGRSLEQISCEPPKPAELRAEFRSAAGSTALSRVVDGDLDDLPTLESVLADLWEVIDQGAPAIKLVERCASDWPELAEAFYVGLRPSLIDGLSRYLEEAAERGICRPVPNSSLAARLILETIAWFAMHRRGDVDGRHYDPITARESTLDALVHAFGPESSCK